MNRKKQIGFKAIIAILLVATAPLAPLGVSPAAARSACDPGIPVGPGDAYPVDQTVYLMVNGALTDCTASVTYSENHVFCGVTYVGDIQSDGITILDQNGNYVGYIEDDGPQ